MSNKGASSYHNKASSLYISIGPGGVSVPLWATRSTNNGCNVTLKQSRCARYVQLLGCCQLQHSFNGDEPSNPERCIELQPARRNFYLPTHNQREVFLSEVFHRLTCALLDDFCESALEKIIETTGKMGPALLDKLERLIWQKRKASKSNI